MDRFDVRVYPRRSGKTTSLVEHLVKAEKDIEVDLVLVLGRFDNITENLLRELPEEVIKSGKFRRGSFFNIPKTIKSMVAISISSFTHLTTTINYSSIFIQQYTVIYTTIIYIFKVRKEY